MDLGTIRTLFYAYLGTPANDPMYPPATANALINAVASKYKQEIFQADPGRFQAVVTLPDPGNGTRLYPLPSDFQMALDVRFATDQGVKLDEVRPDEINAAWAFAAYAIFGSDDSATLQASQFCTQGQALYLMYQQDQPGLMADTDIPTWMPKDFHDLFARDAAIDAYGLGDEAAPSPAFVQETNDRRALFYQKLGRRSVTGKKTRGGT